MVKKSNSFAYFAISLLILSTISISISSAQEQDNSLCDCDSSSAPDDDNCFQNGYFICDYKSDTKDETPSNEPVDDSDLPPILAPGPTQPTQSIPSKIWNGFKKLFDTFTPLKGVEEKIDKNVEKQKEELLNKIAELRRERESATLFDKWIKDYEIEQNLQELANVQSGATLIGAVIPSNLDAGTTVATAGGSLLVTLPVKIGLGIIKGASTGIKVATPLAKAGEDLGKAISKVGKAEEAVVDATKLKKITKSARELKVNDGDLYKTVSNGERATATELTVDLANVNSGNLLLGQTTSGKTIVGDSENIKR